MSFTDREEWREHHRTLVRGARDPAARQHLAAAPHAGTVVPRSGPSGPELHDRMAQAVAMGLHNLDLHQDQDPDGGPADASVHLTLARSHLVEALDAIRDLARPPSGGPHSPIGLAGAIDRYARNLFERAEVRLDAVGDLGVLPATYREQVYIIVREILRDATRRGEPYRVDVSLRTDGLTFTAVVTGDGVQPDPGGTTAGPDGPRLASLRERAEMLGGTLHVADRSPAGTVVTLTVPVPGQRPDEAAEPAGEPEPDAGRPSGSPARLVVVDHSSLFRTGLVALLNSVPTFAVAGEGSTADEAVALCRAHRPDVLILDVQAPGAEPRGFLKDILRDSPDTKVIVLTMRDDSALIRELILAGVSGFLHKSVEYSNLRMAIDSVLARSDQLVLYAPQKSMVADISAETRPSVAMSDRELEVLCHLAEGVSNAEIGRRLFISVSTVKRHLTHVYRKLGAASRVDALHRAGALGLLSGGRHPAL